MLTGCAIDQSSSDSFFVTSLLTIFISKRLKGNEKQNN